MLAVLRKGSHVAVKNTKCTIFKRHAGHSKWQNTRHIRESKNREKCDIALDVTKRMRSAVDCNGGCTDPNQNYALQSAIEAAARANIPKEVWMKYLQKLQGGGEMFHIWLEGPNRSVIRLTFSSTESDCTRHKINVLLKKTSFRKGKNCERAFMDKGNILARLPSTVANQDEAEEAAISAGAEEVKPYEDDGVFQFTSSSEDLKEVTKSLKSAGWKVLQSSLRQEVIFPAELSENEVDLVSKDLQAFLELPEYIDILDNITFGTEQK